MRTLLCLLLPPLLAAQEPASVRDLSLDLRTELGTDPASQERFNRLPPNGSPVK